MCLIDNRKIGCTSIDKADLFDNGKIIRGSGHGYADSLMVGMVVTISTDSAGAAVRYGFSGIDMDRLDKAFKAAGLALARSLEETGRKVK